MKEIIYHATATVARRVTFAAEQGITKDNVLGVIDKTTGKVIYTPLKYTKLSMSQAASPNPDGTKNYTLYFDNAVFPPVGIGDELFVKLYTDEASGSYDEMIANWLGITEATEYTALTPAEAIAIARDCQYNVMGTDWPIPTWLPTGVTEAQVESAAEGLGIPYHEPTQTA